MRARLARTTGGFTESRTVATVDGAGGGTFVRGEAAIHAFFTRLRRPLLRDPALDHTLPMGPP